MTTPPPEYPGSQQSPAAGQYAAAPQYPATPQYGVPQQAPMNTLALIGFILSFFGATVISIVLAGIGLSQIKRTGERGRGLAIAAIWISAAYVVFAIIAVIATVIFALIVIPSGAASSLS